MVRYRIDKEGLFDELRIWGEDLPSPVRLVTCGGTALALLDLKLSTKDIDFLVPDLKEYETLTGYFRSLGWEGSGARWVRPGGEFIFDVFRGRVVYITELLDDPLVPGQHIPIGDYGRVALSALNLLDVACTKLVRCTGVDLDDCLEVIRTGRVTPRELAERFREYARYGLNERDFKVNLEVLAERMADNGLDATAVREVLARWQPWQPSTSR